jgi:hypothetical protein
MVGSTAHAQFKLEKSVVANGGGPMTSAQFSLNGTIGQAVIGVATSTNFQHGIGFWYPTVDSAAGVEATPGYMAGGNMLMQNFPNPFRGSTTIRFSLAHRADVVLKVFSAQGEEVAEPARGQFESGNHDVIVDDQNLASGTYFYQLQVDNTVLRRQMIVAK